MQLNIASDLLEIKDNNKIFKFYRTTTLLTSSMLYPSISVSKQAPFLLVPNTHSFSIFTLQDLKLMFIGPVFSKINCILQTGTFVYVATEQELVKTQRGETVARLDIKNIQSMLKFGDTLVCSCGSNIAVIKDLESINDADDFLQENIDITIDKNLILQYTYDTNKTVKFILHPNTYINKVLIVFDDNTSILFNINTKKIVFSYTFGPVSCITQTDLLDLIAFSMPDGLIKVFNLKKNKVITELNDFVGKDIRQMSFKCKYASILADRLYIYDLEAKKILFNKERAFSGLIINETTALITTQSTIEIITLDDLQVLKSRQMLNKNIKSICEYSKTELLISSNEQLFKLNVYRDEMNRFLKTKTEIETIKVERKTIARSSSLVNTEFNHMNLPNVLLYGERRVSYIDQNLKTHGFIGLKCNCIDVFRDFCLLSTDNNVQIMNLKSKRIICTQKQSERVLSGCLDNNSFTLLYQDRIETWDYEQVKHTCIAFENQITKGSITRYGKMLMIKSETDSHKRKVTVIEEETRITRDFDVEEYTIYDKVLVGVCRNEIKLYDIATGSLIEKVETNKELVGVAVLDDLKFVAVLDSTSNVHLLSNQSHFHRISTTRTSGEGKTRTHVPVERKETDFQRSIAHFKAFSQGSDAEAMIKGLNREEVKEILYLIRKGITTDFFETQRLLRKLLIYKKDMVDKEDIKEIREEVERRLQETEDTVVTALGFLGLEKNKIL